MSEFQESTESSDQSDADGTDSEIPILQGVPDDPSRRELATWVYQLILKHKEGDIVPWSVVERELRVPHEATEFKFACRDANLMLIESHGREIRYLEQGLAICTQEQQLRKNKVRMRRVFSTTRLARRSLTSMSTDKLTDHDRREHDSTKAKAVFLEQAARASAKRKWLTSSEGTKALEVGDNETKKRHEEIGLEEKDESSGG